MKFSYNEFHLWYQLGLSLMASGKVRFVSSCHHQCSIHFIIHLLLNQLNKRDLVTERNKIHKVLYKLNVFK